MFSLDFNETLARTRQGLWISKTILQLVAREVIQRQFIQNKTILIR